ncbi:MAG: SAM-dependent methyltransferase [Bryobacteraceae bacterium]
MYLVGPCSGDPDMHTRKALRILAQAGCVIYDRLVSPEILALANPGAALIDAGKEHVRLKSGDPMVFGRGGMEVEFLTLHGFDVEVVPDTVKACPPWTGPITLPSTR